MPTWLIIVIVAVVVLGIIAAVVAASNKKKTERNRTRAGELREEAAAQATGIQQREARAKETEAEAAQARAEADRKQAEAQRLEAEATERQRAAAEHREQHQEHLRQADELDPDVDTRRDDYTGPEGATTSPTADHDTAGHETRVQDRLGGQHTAPHETDTHGSSDTATVTHPDGSTETVSEPHPAPTTGDPAADGSYEGGTHRA